MSFNMNQATGHANAIQLPCTSTLSLTAAQRVYVSAASMSTVWAWTHGTGLMRHGLSFPGKNCLHAPMQGLLGANFGPGLMSAVGIKDTIARGLAAAGTAGGLGTASLTSR